MLLKKFHLNRILYEFYPFSYFIFGTAFYLLLVGHEVLRVLLLIACFGSGFIALLIRSKHRRIYKKEKTRLSKKLWMPKPVYEFIPVVYVILGFLLINDNKHTIVFIAGLALFSTGCFFIITRIMHRLFLRRA